MGRRFTDGGLLRYRKWVPQQLGDVNKQGSRDSRPMGARHGDTAANHMDLQSRCGRTCAWEFVSGLPIIPWDRGCVNNNLPPLICPLRDCLFELQILLNLLSSKNLSKNIFLHHTIQIFCAKWEESVKKEVPFLSVFCTKVEKIVSF